MEERGPQMRADRDSVFWSKTGGHFEQRSFMHANDTVHKWCHHVALNVSISGAGVCLI